mgnify:CR=1 FL=1
MTGGTDRFATNTDGYARFRPSYPSSILHALRDLIASVACPPDAPVVDVGSGTGIFTRQLAAVLPVRTAVIGVEPSAAMRAQALKEAGVHPGIRYVEGTAEALPLPDGAARAVTAATAAHWFDLPAFFAEAARALAPSGVLAIAEYIRDVDNSPAAEALEAFLAAHGGPKAYVRPDYPAALAATEGFSDVRSFGEDVTFRLSAEAFVGLGLSSSHARAVEARLGKDETRRRLTDLAATVQGNDGTIPYSYKFRLYSARRTG